MRFFAPPSVHGNLLQRSMTHRASYLGALLVALAAVVSPSSAGDSLPLNGRVTATWDNILNGFFAPPANFTGGGPVTHMGKTTQSGTLVLGLPDENFVFPGYGSVTITAANGDKLSFDYIGTLDYFAGE